MPTIEVPLNERIDELESVVELVPPLRIGSVPVTCVPRFTCPERLPNPIQLLAIAKQPAAILTPWLKVEVAVPVWLKLRTERPLPKVELAVPPTLSTPAIVVEPVLEMVKKVEVAKLLVVDPTVKRLSACEVEAAKTDKRDAGVEVPMPRNPVAPLKTSGATPEFPKVTVDDAYSPPCSWSAVEVALTAVAPKVPGVNGKMEVKDEEDTLLLNSCQSEEER